VQEWNEGALDKLLARFSEDVVFHAPVRKSGMRGEIVASGREQFRAAFATLKSVRRTFHLLSVLADDASGSLVLRDDDGDLMNVLVAFDGDRRICRVTSYRQSRAVPA
jgi:ketosteroid isomerase-like protein